MTDEEKEPYKKMALEYKKNNYWQNSEKPKFINKKRKRDEIKNKIKIVLKIKKKIYQVILKMKIILFLVTKMKKRKMIIY